MEPKTLLLSAMVGIAATYFFIWALIEKATTPLKLAIGFVTNFFDTLGIGSYATSTAMFRAWNVVRDELIPGTLNVGHTLPTIIQALIYITIVEVEFATLVAIIGAAVVGAWFGGGIVSKLPRRQIQIGMGIALLAAAGLMLASLTNFGPPPGVALGLSGAKLYLAIGISTVLGALMMLGIGFYAPCMIMISLLGMNPTAAFPIMMGACAFLMPSGSVQFIRNKRYDLSTAMGLTLGGPIAVLIAAFIVKSLPLTAVRWLVVVVVVYTSISMLRTAAQEKSKSPATV
jgi:uncharacterized membrane protein YfcA